MPGKTLEKQKPRDAGFFVGAEGEDGEKRAGPEAAAPPSAAGGGALAVAFVFGPGGQDCGGIHTGKLL